MDANTSQLATTTAAFRMVQIRESLIMAATTVENALLLSADKQELIFISIVQSTPAQQGSSDCPCKLSQIIWLYDILKEMRASGRSVVLCTGEENLMITKCIMLIGSIMILSEGWSVDDLTSIFEPLALHLVVFRSTSHHTSDNLTVHDCWNSLAHAKRLGWVDLQNQDPDTKVCIDLAEHIHYDNPINGNLHVLVPSELVVLECPHDIEGGQWLDVGGERRFGADYYADILCDFEVCCVVQCGPAAYDTGSLQARGIAVERVDADAARRDALMRTVDRLLTLARLAPAPIAVHGSRPGAGGALGAGAEVAVSALLMQRHGFPAKPALAWLCINHPGRPVPALAAVKTTRLAAPGAGAPGRGGPKEAAVSGGAGPLSE